MLTEGGSTQDFSSSLLISIILYLLIDNTRRLLEISGDSVAAQGVFIRKADRAEASPPQPVTYIKNPLWHPQHKPQLRPQVRSTQGDHRQPPILTWASSPDLLPAQKPHFNFPQALHSPGVPLQFHDLTFYTYVMCNYGKSISHDVKTHAEDADNSWISISFGSNFRTTSAFYFMSKHCCLLRNQTRNALKWSKTGKCPLE